MPSYTFDQFLEEMYHLASSDDLSVKVEDRIELSENACKFAQEIVTGVKDAMQEIDGVISKNAKNWTIGRMAPVDRNVIRIASFEIMHRSDIPNTVAINEAINLAKKFGGIKSGAFVNSVLDKIREHIESSD